MHGQHNGVVKALLVCALFKGEVLLCWEQRVLMHLFFCVCEKSVNASAPPSLA